MENVNKLTYLAVFDKRILVKFDEKLLIFHVKYLIFG